MILNENGKLEFITSTFHPFFDISLKSDANIDDSIQFVNYTLPLDILNDQYDIESMNLLNEDFNNVVFTTEKNNIHRYEYYQGVYFIRMSPFSNILRMHILPKIYDGSDAKTGSSVLIFRDNKQSIDETNFSCTEQYIRDEEKNTINLQYQKNVKESSNGFYKFNIKNKTKNFNNLQINLGYSYNDTNPTNPMELKHYTGILDESDESGNIIPQNEFTEWNCALMDANYDNVSDYTNVSKQQLYDNQGIKWPTDTIPYNDGTHDVGFNNPHTINTLYRKTIKYFNDDIYIEENNNYIIQSWKER